MSLPTAWVEALFTKLTLAYGRDFVGRWEGLDLNDVKTDWGHELDGFENHPESIAYALANLPPKAPTVMEFRAACRRAPAVAVPLLASPVASPERVAAELAKLGHIRRHRGAEIDRKDWARAIMVRDAAGERLRPIQVQFAREALGLQKPAAVAA